ERERQARDGAEPERLGRLQAVIVELGVQRAPRRAPVDRHRISSLDDTIFDFAIAAMKSSDHFWFSSTVCPPQACAMVRSLTTVVGKPSCQASMAVVAPASDVDQPMSCSESTSSSRSVISRSEPKKPL